MDRLAAGADGVIGRRCRQLVQQLGGKELHELHGGQLRHGGDDGRDTQRNAALHSAHDTLGEVELVTLQRGEGQLAFNCIRMQQGMQQRIKLRAGVGNLRQVNIEHASELAVDRLIHVDAVLHVGVVAAPDGGCILIRIMGKHIGRCYENGQLRFDIAEVVDEVVGGFRIGLHILPHGSGAVGHGIIQIHHHAKALTKRQAEVILINQVIEIAMLGPVLAEDGACAKECRIVTHDARHSTRFFSTLQEGSRTTPPKKAKRYPAGCLQNKTRSGKHRVLFQNQASASAAFFLAGAFLAGSSFTTFLAS